MVISSLGHGITLAKKSHLQSSLICRTVFIQQTGCALAYCATPIVFLISKFSCVIIFSLKQIKSEGETIDCVFTVVNEITVITFFHFKPW